MTATTRPNSFEIVQVLFERTKQTPTSCCLSFQRLRITYQNLVSFKFYLLGADCLLDERLGKLCPRTLVSALLTEPTVGSELE